VRSVGVLDRRDDLHHIEVDSPEFDLAKFLDHSLIAGSVHARRAVDHSDLGAFRMRNARRCGFPKATLLALGLISRDR
jgi:hypothetical protein